MSDKVKAGHIGMKAKKGFYEWTDESIAKEKARYEQALTGAMEILNRERAEKNGGI
jgi:3-hydroxybutyryl-CoA dehydrogenase